MEKTTVAGLGAWKSYPRATLRGSALRAASRTVKNVDKMAVSLRAPLGVFYPWKASRGTKKNRDMKNVMNKSHATH